MGKLGGKTFFQQRPKSIGDTPLKTGICRHQSIGVTGKQKKFNIVAFPESLTSIVLWLSRAKMVARGWVFKLPWASCGWDTN